MPRWLHTRSKASKRTFGMDKRRSMGKFCPFGSGLNLRNDVLMNAHSSDLSVNALIYESRSTVMHHDMNCVNVRSRAER
jgi:hypothetical protein